MLGITRELWKVCDLPGDNFECDYTFGKFLRADAISYKILIFINFLLPRSPLVSTNLKVLISFFVGMVNWVTVKNYVSMK